MAGSLPSIAWMIRDGNLTHSECADRLGITRSQLDDRLLLMERVGYLVRQNDPEPGTDCAYGHCCASCRKHDPAYSPVRYTLTRKGERLAQKAGAADRMAESPEDRKRYPVPAVHNSRAGWITAIFSRSRN